MRRILSITLVLFMLCGQAFARSAGNLNNGGFVASGADAVFVSTGKQILRIDASGAKAIAEVNAGMLSVEGDRLYYLRRVFDDEKYGYSEGISQTPVSCALDGSDEKIIGDSRILGMSVDYEKYTYDTYVGYRGFTVYNGRIYYLANGSTGGEYDCNVVYLDSYDQEQTQSQTVSYENGISLFSMALDGTDEVELIKNIGNGTCAFAVQDDKIYLASSFADMLYAYYYTNFRVYDLNGELIKEYPGVPDSETSFFSQSGKYYAIVDGCQADSGDMYVGLQESEGDFRSSQLVKLNDDGTTAVEAVQDSMIDSVIDAGSVYYVGSASQNTFYDDEFDYNETLGIYVKKLGSEGLGQKLVALKDDEVYGVAISVINGDVYYKNAEGEIYKITVSDGKSEMVAK